MRSVSRQEKNRTRFAVELFPGFAAPTSNTTYTPNQFFDVCVPHYSRGVVRLIAFLIRQALGWCDTEGNPRHERIRVSYRELVSRAGIARSEIRKTLDAALQGGFIECVHAGQASRAYSPAESAYYQLRWDSRPDYIKDPKEFRGFFEGEGNRTDIPNQFFDYVVPTEPLSVIKVVASITRFSIGFQARHGGRRQEVHLSYSDIQRYTHLRDRHTLADALRRAEDRHYIYRIEQGYFDPNAGRESRPGRFTLRWADTSPFITGLKNPPAKSEPHRSENPTGTGSENPPVNQSENLTDIQTKPGNEISKQQQVDAATSDAFAPLKREGFTEKTARVLAAHSCKEQILAQIAWLPHRAPSRNRLGMLRRAIEEGWPAPEELRHAEVSAGREFARHFYAGLAGNAGMPVAEPSAKDTELAGRFVERLLATKPVKTDVIAWAREFAAYVNERRSARDVISLVLALRTHGDGWLLRFSRTQQHLRDKAQETVRAAHRKKHESAWFRFLAEAEETRRQEQPEEYARFLAQHQSSAGCPPWQTQSASVSLLSSVIFSSRTFGLGTRNLTLNLFNHACNHRHQRQGWVRQEYHRHEPRRGIEFARGTCAPARS
jgi:hypothetical protein